MKNTAIEKLLNWRREHGGRYPSRAFLSPLAQAEYKNQHFVMHQDADRGVVANIAGTDWFVDPMLSDDEVRFEA